MIGRRISLSAVATALALVLGSAAPAQDELTPDMVARQVAERYGVEVLRVVEGEDPAGPVYIVTVMNPGGNYNGAFRVTRLMVNRSTGELVPQLRHGPTGYELRDDGGTVTRGANGRAIRRMSDPQGSG